MLKIEHFTKKYGDKIAVDDLSLTVEDGQICAFIGHNGAGKTTTLKAIAGIITYDNGKITINDVDIQSNPMKAKHQMAYLPDNPDLYEHLKGMGTTVVAATIMNQMMYFANVGDSRLYLINQGIQQLTKDHSLVEEMVRLGGIKPEEAKHHPDKNIITRAIGAKADVDVDFYEHRLKRGDIILMCTDGLSNMVEDEDLFRIIRQDKDLQEIGGELLMKANRNGGLDNIAVVLVEIDNSEVRI